MPHPIINNRTKQRFELVLDEGTAVLDYELRGTKLYLTHAGTPDAARGQGIAAEVTKAALEWAREEGFTVVPLCSYVVAYLRRHPEYSSLVT